MYKILRDYENYNSISFIVKVDYINNTKKALNIRAAMNPK